MKKPIDLTGEKYGRLTVIKKAYKKDKFTYWLCECDCGNYTTVERGNLRSGHTKSCGCLQKEMHKAPNHLLRKHRLYNIWTLMKTRCYNPNSKLYKYYGKRNIKVCEEWKNNIKIFYDWAMANGYQDNLTIDRIDVNGNYEPSNCRWVSRKTQSRNLRSNITYTYNNETHCISEWAEIYNIRRNTLWNRLNKGWDIEKALNTPVKKYKLN